jgi:signal transduction histidine kinase
MSIKADWSRFELILFNIIQNAVKFNVFNGEIVILLRCLPQKPCNDKCMGPDDYVLETEVIDTGHGISFERQKMLFVPFLELKIKQSLQQVKDNSIGMGLACSSAIAGALGGDITLKKSVKGFTAFAFKIPVQSHQDILAGE